MVVKRKMVGAGRKKRVMRGRGILDKLKKIGAKLSSANDWFKKTQVVSKLGAALKDVPVIGSYAGKIGESAAAHGYGRRKRMAKKRGKGMVNGYTRKLGSSDF